MPASEEPAAVAAAEGPRRSPAAVLCKNKTSTPGKKLVQARLPFKRLNPVPKENAEGVLDVKKVKTSKIPSSRNSLPKLDTSTESLENDCQLDSEINSPPPKTLNGPLDQFLKRRKDVPAPPSITIDLTEDSNSAHVDHGCSKGTNTNLQKDTTSRIVQHAKNTSKPVMCQEDQSDVPMETENLVSHTVAEPMDQRGPCLPKVGFGGKGLTMSQEERALMLHGKKPVVVLEDIMTSNTSILGHNAGNLVFEDTNKEVDEDAESSPEVESAPEVEAVSPASSLSADSSPLAGSVSEAGSSPGLLITQETKNRTSPSSLTTPVRKMTPKTSKPSSEKRRKEQDERRKKFQAEKEEKDRLKEEAKNARERAKEEAKKKKDEEKEQKDKEKKEKRDKEEQEKKEKKEKEEKDKAEKLRQKEEKRKEKQDALEAKLEEKRKKEEEKRVKEEEKRIKAGKSEITRFFQKPKTQHAPKTFASPCGKFAPFEIKKNMALSPLCRVDFDQDAAEKLDELLETQTHEGSYLKELKCRKPRTCRRTFVHHHVDPVSSDVIVVENGETDDVQDMPEDPLDSDLLVEDSGAVDSVPERTKFGRMKLLQFSENHRPAYWGTWNKQSGVINPKKPWLKDKLLDYEVDSDEEWEEEEPGESLSHSEGDDDDEAGEDEEDDDGFFVPHGYLSEDEGAAEEERADPENQKVRQKLKAKEWDDLVSEGKKLRVLKPLVIGCIWESNGASRELKALQRFAACILESVVAEEELAQEKCEKRNIKDQLILAKLLPLLHGNFNASKVIIQEFQECCRRGLLIEGSGPAKLEKNGTSQSTSSPQTPTAGENTAIPSKARLKRIISESSTYEKRPDIRMCWYVHAEVLKKFGQEGLPVPCQWTYVTQVNSAAREDTNNSPGTLATQTTPVSVKRKSSGSMSITKFMKRPKEDKVIGVVETDGFQADTEDEDDDCIVVDVQPSKGCIAEANKKATLSVETIPKGILCVSNPATSEMTELESTMETVPFEAAGVNMDYTIDTVTNAGGMVSKNCEMKTFPSGKAMICIDSAMDIVPNEGATCTKSEKTLPSGSAVAAKETVLIKGALISIERKIGTVSSSGARVCIESATPTAPTAGAIVGINSAIETVPNTGAMISIPNQA